MPTTHVARVAVSRPGRYIFVPVCSCGWTYRGFAADHAAQIMVDDHLATEARRLENYIAGRAGGTATDEDVARWTRQLAALRGDPAPACDCGENLRPHQHVGCDRDPARTAPRSIVKRPADHGTATVR